MACTLVISWQIKEVKGLEFIPSVDYVFLAVHVRYQYVAKEVLMQVKGAIIRMKNKIPQTLGGTKSTILKKKECTGKLSNAKGLKDHKIESGWFCL